MNLKFILPGTLLISIIFMSCSNQEETNEFIDIQDSYCWDSNGNGMGDLESEDLNNDGKVDKLDCRGWESNP
ncbi:MAG: hypothetical protein AAGD17_09835 [Bacteroidota bacterium]